VIEPSVDGVPLVVLDDWLLVVPWFIVDELFTSVDVWLALVELFTLRSPPPTFTPGLMFAAALRSVLLMPTLAFTSTLGLTLSRLPDEVEGDDVGDAEPELVDDAWPLVTPWFMFDVAPMLLEVWLAFTLLEVVLLPVVEPLVPVLTPGLTFTPAFTLELATPTLALTPTLGFTFVVLDDVVPGVVPLMLPVRPVDGPLVVPRDPLTLPDIAPLVLPAVVPDATDPVLPVDPVAPVEPAMEPCRALLVTSVVEPTVFPVAAVVLPPSGRQSMCTALAE
jgi:hypothetical protein